MSTGLLLMWVVSLVAGLMGVWMAVDAVKELRQGKMVSGWLGMLLGLLALFYTGLLVILITA